MKIKKATRTQISTILAAAVNATARAMAQKGVALSHKQADEIGDLGVDWLKNRLNLQVVETDQGVVCIPKGKE